MEGKRWRRGGGMRKGREKGEEEGRRWRGRGGGGGEE